MVDAIVVCKFPPTLPSWNRHCYMSGFCLRLRSPEETWRWKTVRANDLLRKCSQGRLMRKSKQPDLAGEKAKERCDLSVWSQPDPTGWLWRVSYISDWSQALIFSYW